MKCIYFQCRPELSTQVQNEVPYAKVTTEHMCVAPARNPCFKIHACQFLVVNIDILAYG